MMRKKLPIGLIASSLFVGATAEAARLSDWPERYRARQFAERNGAAAKQVLALHTIDLDQVDRALGFSLGRLKITRSKGSWSYAAVVIYYRCGKKTCTSKVGLGGGDRVRALQVVDLAQKETRVTPRRGWPRLHGRRIKEPPRKTRWPVLLLETERGEERQRERALFLISLRDLAQPSKLLRLVSYASGYDDGGGLQRRRVRRRFGDARVLGLRLFRVRGKPPQLEVAKKRASPRYSRCRQEPATERYELKGDRFVPLPSKQPAGGCR